MTLIPNPSNSDFPASTSREQAEQAGDQDLRSLGTGLGTGSLTEMHISSIDRRSACTIAIPPGKRLGLGGVHRSLARRAGLPPIWLYGAVVLTGAWLIFWIQPLAVRGVLPVLGGSPAVWNTAMVFFQAALLGGYALAHCLARAATPRAQLVAVVALWAGIALSAPAGAVRLLGETPDGLPPTLWLLGTLAGSLGLAFVAVSTLTPLVQHWLARAGAGAASSDPYFLYSASNAGSAGALIAFPFVIEPLLGLTGQAWLWSAAALLLAPLLFVLWRPAAKGDIPARDVRRDAESPVRGAAVALPVRRILALSAVPSALLLGVTRYVTTDVAAVPLLWVLPLGLYLATFVHAFARRPAVPQSLLARLVAPALIALAILYILNPTVLAFGLAHLFVFVLAALYCHGELARLRPPAAGLTRFYLLVSTGGLIGGMLVALAAPLLFVEIYEYPIALALVAALLPRGAEAPRRVHYIFGGAAVVAVVTGLVAILDGFGQSAEGGLSAVTMGLCLVSVVLCAPGLLVLRPRPALLAGALLAVLVAPTLIARHGADHVALERTFFGSYRVTESEGLRSFYHGTTLHGAELRLPDGTVESRTTYYAPDTPYGDVMAGLARRPDPLVIGLAGLGTGSLACYARPGDELRFYEIDPAVVRLARKHFAALRDCAPDATVGIGDARLLLARESSSFDFLTVDAFSSDAIPVHLLTLEAFRIYLNVLAPEGVLAVHISNRHIDLEPVIAGLAARTGLAARAKRYTAPSALQESQASNSSHVVVLARDEETLLGLGLDEGWVPLGTPDRVRVWTDDYTSIIPLLRWW